jgi:hypothetical protein
MMTIGTVINRINAARVGANNTQGRRRSAAVNMETAMTATLLNPLPGFAFPHPSRIITVILHGRVPLRNRTNPSRPGKPWGQE